MTSMVYDTVFSSLFYAFDFSRSLISLDLTRVVPRVNELNVNADAGDEPTTRTMGELRRKLTGDVDTHVIINKYGDRTLVLVTQRGKVGNLVCNVRFVQDKSWFLT